MALDKRKSVSSSGTGSRLSMERPDYKPYTYPHPLIEQWEGSNDLRVESGEQSSDSTRSLVYIVRLTVTTTI